MRFSSFDEGNEHEMKLIADIAGQSHEVNIERNNDEPTRFVAVVDGRRYQITARDIAAGIRLISNGGRVYQCRVDKTATAHGATGIAEVYVGNQAYAVNVIDPKRRRSGQRAEAQQLNGSAQIVAPMPGKIVRVIVEQGANVEAGDGLLVVEAMKMQNEMKAPRAGVVVKLTAETGATVNAGDVLAVIE